MTPDAFRDDEEDGGEPLGSRRARSRWKTTKRSGARKKRTG
jgi:hypothetical protein